MSTTIIPQGYRIHVTSWENDGDNYKTEIMEGVSKEVVPFIVATCELLKGCFGNMYEPSNTEMDAYKDALQQLINKYPNRPKYCDTPNGVDENLLYELGLTCTEFRTRVLDKIKIEYVPEAIVLQDVTKEFV